MFQKLLSAGTVAVALGLWIGMPDGAQAQKGGGGGGRGGGGGGGGRSMGGGGGGGGRSMGGGGGGGGRSMGGGGRSIGGAGSFSGSPSIRSAPASSFKNFSGSANRNFPSANSASSLKNFAPANQSNLRNSFAPGNSKFNTGTAGINKLPPGAGSGKGPSKGNHPGNPYWNSAGHNNHNYHRNSYYYGSPWWGYWGGYYRNPYYYNNNNFWQYALYSGIANWIGFGPFGYSGYGVWGSTPYFYGALNGYYSQAAPAQAPARSGSAVIEVSLPDPNAVVWIDGAETASRGTSRRYESPVLEAGWNYSYSIRAAWTTDDGETRVIERQVPLSPGGRVIVDFTTTPSRVTVQ